MHDINIMWMSPLFNDIMNGIKPSHVVKYKIEGETFR